MVYCCIQGEKGAINVRLIINILLAIVVIVIVYYLLTRFVCPLF